MSKRDSISFLEDILNSCRKIQRYIENKTYDEFIKDELVVDAVVRNLEIIGEATKKLPTDLKKKHKNIEWKKIAGLRDILIHEYFGVDYEILWDIVKNKIPVLKTEISKIIEEIKNKLGGAK